MCVHDHGCHAHDVTFYTVDADDDTTFVDDVNSDEICVDDVVIVINDAINVAHGTVIVFDAFASPPSSPSSESRRRWCDAIVTGIRSWCG
jgi:predicted dehydrogenase